METPRPELIFRGICPDCGIREFPFPGPLPDPGDDFDWRVRDYDGFRRFMLEEMAARFPERRRWTPADLEVVLLEALAALLDQLSDMADRVTAEAFLETARRPGTVRRLLEMIGFDAAAAARGKGEIGPGLDPLEEIRQVERLWTEKPHLMEEARRAGPRTIHIQRRMVTLDDYALRLETHPLVLKANAQSTWTGSWTTIRVAVILWGNTPLDEAPAPSGSAAGYPDELASEIASFHRERGIPLPPLSPAAGTPPTVRSVLRPFLDAWRMAGQEVILQDAVRVGIVMRLSIRVAENYFQSEVRRAVEQALGTGPDGFFAPGRLRFGEDLFAGDIFQALMSLDGVENVCLNKFKKMGDQYPDETGSGCILLDGIEIAVCDNDPARPERGYFRLRLHGGLKG